jgi:hypothetical protein
VLFSQIKSGDDSKPTKSLKRTITLKQPAGKKDATIDVYRFIFIERDATYLETSLAILIEYGHHYLKKDNFWLLAFSNVGQTYNALPFGLTKFSQCPGIGFNAKHFNFLYNRS